MTKELFIKKREIIRSLRSYRKGILNVLLLKASQLKGELEELWITGVCEKNVVCLDDFETEDKDCYIVVKRDIVSHFLSVLDQLDEHNAIQEIHDFTHCDDWADLFMYPAFDDLMDLLWTYESAFEAEKHSAFCFHMKKGSCLLKQEPFVYVFRCMALFSF